MLFQMVSWLGLKLGIFLILTHIKNLNWKQICSLNFVFHLQVNADRPVMDYAISRLCEAARDPVRVHLSFEDVAVTGHFQMGSRRSSVCGTTTQR